MAVADWIFHQSLEGAIPDRVKNEFEREGRWFLSADMAREKKDVLVVRSSAVCAGGMEDGESTNWVI